MAASSFVIHDAATGEILRVILGSAAVAEQNLQPGEAMLDAGGELVSSERRYVADPEGAAVLTDRPDMGVTLPETVAEGGEPDIAGLPEGAVVDTETVGGAVHVVVRLFPYRTVTGRVTVAE